MSQIKNKFLGPIEATPAKPNAGIQQGDAPIAAIGRLQGQIDNGSSKTYATYADALADLYADAFGPNQIVYVQADETNSSVPAIYMANTNTNGLVLDFDFTTQTYGVRALTLLTLVSIPLKLTLAADGFYDMQVIQ